MPQENIYIYICLFDKKLEMKNYNDQLYKPQLLSTYYKLGMSIHIRSNKFSLHFSSKNYYYYLFFFFSILTIHLFKAPIFNYLF
jgi:hypothetical protein